MAVIAASLKPRSVLIATDFSETSENTLRHSLALARFYGSRSCLAHVVSWERGWQVMGQLPLARRRFCAKLHNWRPPSFEAALWLAFSTNLLTGAVNCGRSCKRSSDKRARISSSSAHLDDKA